MENADREALRQWVRRWQIVGPKLAELRRRELADTDTTQALLGLADAFESCRLHHRPAPTSGLVVQQALFRRLRPAG
jgi:hypothetical protein